MMIDGGWMKMATSNLLANHLHLAPSQGPNKHLHVLHSTKTKNDKNEFTIYSTDFDIVSPVLFLSHGLSSPWSSED